MRKRTFLLGFGVVAAGLLASFAIAGGGAKNFTAGLNGYNEPPAVSTNGSGTFNARIDDEADTITYELTYGGLNATAFAAHIHLGQRNVNGGVSAFLCGGGGKPPCPPGTTEAGTVSGVIMPADVIGPTGQGIAAGEFEELVRAIRAGVTYANVHSSTQPGGEIRGQIRNGR
jgi:hypothetical protein